MDKLNETPEADLIDLGAASVATQGGQQVFGEIDGHNLPMGISED